MLMPLGRTGSVEVGALSPFDLNLRHLRALVAVCDHGSISAAATAISISQPALTQGIVKLEKHLGLALFERRATGMRPTDAGALLRERVNAAFAQLAAGARLVAGPGFEPDRRLTMAQLRSFLALVQAGSYAAAAGAIGLSEAAAHRAVHGMETALGRQLVERRGRGVALNHAGRRFARSCRLAIGEIEAAFSDLGLDPGSAAIAIGTTPLARALLVPEAMALMNAQQIPAGFKVFEGSWGELVETLRDGVIDIIVGEVPAYDSPDIVKVPLYQEAAVIVAGRQHPLAGAKVPSPRALASYPWIIGPENSPLRAEWERLFASHRPAAPIECGSIMIVGRLLTSSDMLTLATPDQVALQIRSGLLARVGPPLRERHTIGITLRQGWRPTVAQARFLQLLRDVSASMVSDGSRISFIEAEWVQSSGETS